MIEYPFVQFALPLAQAVNTFRILPQITVGILGLTVLYFVAIGPLRRRYNWGAPASPGNVVAFVLAMLVLFVALQGPIDTLGESYLFSVHMVQHLLITLIMPPLLIKGLPTWLINLPLRVPLVLTVGRLITKPIITVALFNIIFVLWHVPALYDAALQNPAIHAFEHVLFMGSATLMWWPIFSPTPLLPRLHDGIQIFYLFVQSIPSTLLGALITFADVVLYPTYAVAPRIVGTPPLDDQQFAGLIMWFGGAGIAVLLMAQRFIRWMEHDEDDDVVRA